jgi:hypothetical protein
MTFVCRAQRSRTQKNRRCPSRAENLTEYNRQIARSFYEGSGDDIAIFVARMADHFDVFMPSHLPRRVWS